MRRNSVSVADGCVWGPRSICLGRWMGDGVSVGRASPKRCADFGNERAERGSARSCDWGGSYAQEPSSPARISILLPTVAENPKDTDRHAGGGGGGEKGDDAEKSMARAHPGEGGPVGMRAAGPPRAEEEKAGKQREHPAPGEGARAEAEIVESREVETRIRRGGGDAEKRGGEIGVELPRSRAGGNGEQAEPREHEQRGEDRDEHGPVQQESAQRGGDERAAARARAGGGRRASRLRRSSPIPAGASRGVRWVGGRPAGAASSLKGAACWRKAGRRRAENPPPTCDLQL